MRQKSHSSDLSSEAIVKGIRRRVRPSTPSHMKRCCRAPHHRFGQLRAPHDLVGAAALGRRQDDLGALDVLLLGVAIPDNGLQSKPVAGRDSDPDPCSHAHSMNCFANPGNPLNASHH